MLGLYTLEKSDNTTIIMCLELLCLRLCIDLQFSTLSIRSSYSSLCVSKLANNLKQYKQENNLWCSFGRNLHKIGKSKSFTLLRGKDMTTMIISTSMIRLSSYLNFVRLDVRVVVRVNTLSPENILWLKLLAIIIHRGEYV